MTVEEIECRLELDPGRWLGPGRLPTQLVGPVGTRLRSIDPTPPGCDLGPGHRHSADSGDEGILVRRRCPLHVNLLPVDSHVGVS